MRSSASSRITLDALAVPVIFLDGESVECREAWIQPTATAIVGELLRVDDSIMNEPSLRDVLRIFLKSAFEPSVIGFGKVRIVFKEREESIIFVERDSDRNDW